MLAGIDLLMVFRGVILIGIAFLAARLYSTGPFRRYRVFWAYLLFWISRSVVLLNLNVKSALYAKLWIVSEPILWLFYILLVLELYSLVLENHKGLYSLGRWSLYGALGLSLLVSMLIFIPAASGPYARSVVLPYLFLFERGLFCSLVVFLLAALFLVTRYPIRLSRNVIIHSVVYSVFFLSNTLGSLFLSVLGSDIARTVNVCTTVGSAICVAIWLGFINAEGETVTATMPRVWRPGQEERLVGQLNDLNNALLRAARTRASVSQS